jgi:sugar lactone lactonase YvrE
MQEGLNADNSLVYAEELTSLDAAEELPHSDLDRSEALDLLAGVFDPMLRAPADVFDELDVERFLSANSAIIAAGDQPESSGVSIGSPPADRYEGPALLESTIPLRAESDTGKTEPVDLSLEREADGDLSPSNPLVALSLPQQLGDGIKLPESGITLELPSAPDQLAPSTLDQGVAAYPEVAEDTTFAVSPAPGGFETFTLLQSADAPTSQTFTLDLPADATLVETDAGGAEVKRNGKPIMGVSPPTATDAAGASVPVAMSVSGDTLSLSVSPAASTSFPVLVDPLYETYNWWNGITGLGGWHGYTNASSNYYFETKATCTSYASPYSCGSGVTANAPGLYIAELPGAVPVNSQVNWQFEVPRWNEEWAKYNRVPKSFITNLIYRNVGFWHRTDPAPSPTLWMGIWNSLTPGWVSGYAVGGNSQNILGNGEFEFGAGGSTAGKQASFAVSNTDGHNLTAVRDAFVNTAIVTIADTEAPNLAPAVGPWNWVNQVPSEPITVTAADYGLGVYRLKVAPEGPPPVTPWPVQSNNCTGNTVWPCSGDATFTLTKHGSGSEETRDYDPSVMPQGIDNVLLTAEDPLGNKSETRVVKVSVDHTAPVVGPLSGTATEQGALGTKLVKYGLNYSASDGEDAAAAALAPWGTAGTGTGQLEHPYGLATDGSGDSWVTDTVNNRVVEFDKEGKYVRQITTANGVAFKELRGITIAPDGNVWVAEKGNNRVMKFSATGQFVSQFTSTGLQPFDVAVTSGGIVWVTDPIDEKVFRFKEDGTLLQTIDKSGWYLPAGPQKPYGIDLDEFGNAWIAIQGTNAGLELSPTGGLKWSFSTSGSGNGQLNAPFDVAVAPSGNIFVSDSGNNRIQEFKPNGSFLRTFGSLGSGSNQLNGPKGIDVLPGNKLAVADFENHRLARWEHADQDPQSGAAKVAVKVDGITKATNAPGCPEKNCVINGSWSLNADEYTVGSHKVEVVATDAAGISSAAKTVSVETHGDRTAPTVVLSGSITEQATLGKTLPSYKLKVAATDPGPAEERKSGVAKLEIKVDGALVDSTSPGCPSEGCSLNREWTLSSSSYLGSHFVTATATDAAGTTKTVVQTIEVLRDETAPEFRNLSAFYTAPSGWVEQEDYEPKVDVLDAKGYGVTSVQLKIDGKVVQSATQTCSAGSCSKQFGYGQPINMATYSGGAHPAELVATDGAGNMRKRAWTINVNPSDSISGEEAIDTLEASDDTAEATVVASAAAVISPFEKADGNDPSIGQSGESLVVTGVPTETKIPDDPTAPITVPTPEGSLNFDPLSGAGGGDPTVANGAAIVTPNTDAAVDTVVRPIYDGFLAFADIRDSSAPEKYSWRVVMGKGQALKQIDAQTAVVEYPEDGTTAAMIRAEPAHDATGKEVITSLTVEGTDVVTLTVQHTAPGLVYPVVGGPRFEVGYVTVRAVIPPEPEQVGPEEEAELTEYWESAPEPATASAAEVTDLAEPLARLSKGHIDIGIFAGSSASTERGFSRSMESRNGLVATVATRSKMKKVAWM